MPAAARAAPKGIAMSLPCALARSKLHALPTLPPPAMGVLRTPEDRFEVMPGYRYVPKYADVADVEKVCRAG